MANLSLPADEDVHCSIGSVCLCTVRESSTTMPMVSLCIGLFHLSAILVLNTIAGGVELNAESPAQWS